MDPRALGRYTLPKMLRMTGNKIRISVGTARVIKLEKYRPRTLDRGEIPAFSKAILFSISCAVIKRAIGFLGSG